MKLYGSDKYTDAVDLENEVEFTLGEWALRSETLVTEDFGDRFNSWFIRVELAEDAPGGLYVLDAQTRPDLSQDHRTTREEILAEDRSLLGALLPRDGGSVQGYFENEWDSYGSRWAETDPYYIVTPEGDGFDALIWVEGDALFDTWMKLWKCCDLNEDVLWEPDNPAAVLTDDTGFYPGWYRGDERSNLEARGRNQLSVMRLQLDADTAYLLWAWNVHAFTSYKMNFVQVEEPGDTAATAVSLSPDRQYEKVRGGNIGEATDVDYFKLVLDRERELMIRAVAADGVLALVGGIYTGEGGSDAFSAAHVAHDRFTNDHFYYTTALAYRVGNGFTIQHTFPAGTYYVKVEGDGANTGAYYIAVENDLAVPEEWDCVDSDDQYPDPLWGCQFTLKNDDEDGLDLNIVPAWEAGAAGTGVRVRVVDGSFDTKSIELVDNVVAATDHSDSEKGTVLNPFPGIGYSHGTASAAVIAARDNGLGMRGIAPRAQLSLHNAIDFPTDDIIIRSLSYNEGDDLIADVGLMSHSWGVFQGSAVPQTSAQCELSLCVPGIRRSAPGFEQVQERSSREQVELQEAQDLAHGPRHLVDELQVGEQEMHAHRDPDLRHDGIARSADEALDAQVLLDPPEEGLDLPTLLVDVRDGLRGELEVVGQERVELLRVGVAIADSTQRDRTPGAAFDAGQLDGLVRRHAQPRRERPPLSNRVLDLALQPSDQENSLCIKGFHPLEVEVQPVRSDDASLRQTKGPRHLNVRPLAVRDLQERRQTALVVKPHVQLQRSLRLAVLRPGKQLQAQVHVRRIEREQLVAEPETMPRRRLPASRQQTTEQRLVQLVGLPLVDARQRRPGHPAHAKVVELVTLRVQVRHDVAQAAPPGKLGRRHRYELAPAAHRAQLASPVAPSRLPLELMSRHQLEELTEYGTIVRHGSGSPCRHWLCVKTNHTTGHDSDPS